MPSETIAWYMDTMSSDAGPPGRDPSQADASTIQGEKPEVRPQHFVIWARYLAVQDWSREGPRIKRTIRITADQLLR